MKERIIKAMHTVWVNRCREICRDVEWGSAYGFSPAAPRAIAMARSKSTKRIVGIFHMRPVGPGEYELMNERTFSPPVHESTLPKFYQIMVEASQTARFSCIPAALETEALRDCEYQGNSF